MQSLFSWFHSQDGIKIILTPGHTSGSITLLLDGQRSGGDPVAFTGDHLASRREFSVEKTVLGWLSDPFTRNHFCCCLFVLIHQFWIVWVKNITRPHFTKDLITSDRIFVEGLPPNMHVHSAWSRRECAWNLYTVHVFGKHNNWQNINFAVNQPGDFLGRMYPFFFCI